MTRNETNQLENQMLHFGIPSKTLRNMHQEAQVFDEISSSGLSTWNPDESYVLRLDDNTFVLCV